MKSDQNTMLKDVVEVKDMVKGLGAEKISKPTGQCEVLQDDAWKQNRLLPNDPREELLQGMYACTLQSLYRLCASSKEYDIGTGTGKKLPSDLIWCNKVVLCPKGALTIH